jgi:hypothetical protein
MRRADLCRVAGNGLRWEFNRKNGAQRRIRTTDTRIFSPLLYQLSYLGLFRQTKLRWPDFIKAPWGAP